MKNGSSHLVAGMALGALIGAYATYFIIKHQGTLKRDFDEVAEKVKHGVHDFAHKAKEKAEEFGYKAKEKANEFDQKTSAAANRAEGTADAYSQDLNNSTTY